jgi:hypothetical protein
MKHQRTPNQKTFFQNCALGTFFTNAGAEYREAGPSLLRRKVAKNGMSYSGMEYLPDEISLDKREPTSRT